MFIAIFNKSKLHYRHSEEVIITLSNDETMVDLDERHDRIKKNYKKIINNHRNLCHSLT